MFSFYSCNTCSRPGTVESITVNLADLADLAVDSFHINISGKQLFASEPKPIGVAMLIKNWGNPNPALLNDPANASGYLTKKKMALNFGIYITDMVSAGLYGQTQTVLRYKQAVTPLVEGLGLQSAIDRGKEQLIEKNLNNKKELLNIISDIYASCTAFLSEDDRDFYALAMLTGGWVEGMYIGASMIDESQSSNESKMKQLVMDNKATFDILWQALGQIDNIPEEATTLMFEMSYIAQIFGHQTLLSTPPNAGIVNTEDDVTPKLFADLKNYVQLLRQQFVKK
jgi:hypothetical protein